MKSTSTQPMTAITIEEFRDRIILNAHHNPARGSLMAFGPPGVGKTKSAKQAVAMLNDGCTINVNGRTHTIPPTPTVMVYFHLVTSTPEEFGGVLATVERDGAIVADKLPLERLRTLIAPDETVVVLMDDIGQALPAVIGAAMQLPEERRIDGHALSDRVLFVACSNRAKDKAGVHRLITPFLDRMSVYVTRFDFDGWARWALTTGSISPDVLAYVAFMEHPSSGSRIRLSDWSPSADEENKAPTPRGVERMSHLIGIGLDAVEDVQAAVGSDYALGWQAFKTAINGLPSVDLLLRSPDAAGIPNNPQTQFLLMAKLAHRFGAEPTPAVGGAIHRYIKRFVEAGHTGIEKVLVTKFIEDLSHLPNADEVLEAGAEMVVSHGRTSMATATF